MSHIFQRPLCDLGRAYDYAFRPALGDPGPGSGGPCDDRPHPVQLRAADGREDAAATGWRSFSLCPEHEGQLRQYDARMPDGSRFRDAAPVGGPR